MGSPIFERKKKERQKKEDKIHSRFTNIEHLAHLNAHLFIFKYMRMVDI